MQKNTQKSNHVFNLRQHAAFALMSNRALDSYDSARKTQNFFNIIKKGNLAFPETEVKNLLEKIRNYSSHRRHDDLDQLSPSLVTFFQTLEKRARLMFFARYHNNNKNNPAHVAWLANHESPLFLNDTKKPLHQFPQPDLVFMLALFLTKGEISYLFGKIYFGKDAFQDVNGKLEDTPRTAAIKGLLKLLALPDNVIIRNRTEEDEPWLDPNIEQGFAIYENLRLNFSGQSESQDSDKTDTHLPMTGKIPDHYLMRQLIQFIEHHNILEGFSFARVATINKEGEARQGRDLLEQHITFDRFSTDEGEDSRLNPLCLKYNTVIVQTAENIQGTLSLEVLMLIVAVYLNRPKGNDTAKIREFISDWLKQNQSYGHLEPKVKPEKELADVIKNRCLFLLEKQKQLKAEARKFDQIRFICQRINHVWRCHFGEAMHSGQYKQLEDQVRYFKKDNLRAFLTDVLWQKDGVGLGRGNEKPLGKCITKDRLEDVFKDLSKAWEDYLCGVKEGLHKKTEEEHQAIARDLSCRLPTSKKVNAPPSMPVGLPPKVFKDEFKVERNFSFFQSLVSFCEYPKPEDSGKPKEDADARREWCRRKLLLAMATFSIGELTEKFRSPGGGFVPLADLDISISVGNSKITMKLGKSWRNHARYGQKFLATLIKNYLGGAKSVPLFRADEKEKGQSVESALVEYRRERALFLEALLEFEEDWIRKNKEVAEKNQEADGGYINFSTLCTLADVKDLPDWRNTALHAKDKVKRFSECPEPLQSKYQALAKRQQDKRNTQKKKHVRT